MKKVFPGGNTAVGFFSFYDYILPEDARKIILIKGGPGVGKSTFMRYIAETLYSKGHPVELHCCSSDNESLDGVVFPQSQVALVDGTAPHLVDPKNPGAVDEILNLGNYWDEKGIRRNREHILSLNKLIKELFQSAYNYLAQASLLNKEREKYYRIADAVDFLLLDRHTSRLIKELFPGEGNSLRERHLFASAISPGGLVNHLPSIFDNLEHRVIITGDAGTGKATLVARIYHHALLLDYQVEAFHCSLNPSQIEHIYIPELSLGVITSVKPHVFQPKQGDTIINTADFIRARALSPYTADLEEANRRFGQAIERALDFIRRAKQAHDEMEAYYIPNMDFAAIDKVREETLERLTSYLIENH